MSTKTPSMRQVRLVGATGEIRTAQFDGREHMVVPVVAMVEGVVWAVNSDVPEFVPAEELAETPQQWNGRRCFAGHPEDGGTQVTANTPRTLEQSFGVLFDTSDAARILKTRRLETLAYLDPVKAAQVGKDAVDVIERLRAGERVEVSVGAYVEAEDTDGTYEGKEYHGVWRNIVSDHLAFLKKSQEGACSIEAGCGAPRTAVRHLITAAGIKCEAMRQRLTPIQVQAATDLTEVDVTFTDGTTLSGLKVYDGTEIEADDFAGRTIAKIGPAKREASMADSPIKKRFDLLTAEGVSDSDIRRSLDKALQTVDGYMGIDCVYPDEKQVVYYVSSRDEWKMKRRSYSMTEGGEAVLSDDAIEVEPVTTYEPVTAAEVQPKAAAAAQPKAAGGCGCKEKKVMALDKTKRAELVAALITDQHSGFKEGDEAFLNLEAVSDARLEEFQTAAVNRKAAAEAAAKTETDHRAAAAKVTVLEGKLRDAEKPRTKEQILADLNSVPELKTLLDNQAAQEAAERETLIVELVKVGADTKEQLTAMSTGELKTLAKYAKVATPTPDFSGQGVPRRIATAASGDAKTAYAPPDPYAEPLEKMRAAKTVN